MHAEAYAYLTQALTPELVKDAAILEIGSYNVNGTARTLCGGCRSYTGVDRRDGPGVDVVDPNDSFDGAGRFDLVISSETLEHAPDPAGLLASAARALKPGGTLVLTAAAPPRAPHGCDGGHVGDEFYCNITVAQLESLLADWQHVHITYDPAHGDIYATAQTPPARATRRTRKTTNQ